MEFSVKGGKSMIQKLKRGVARFLDDQDLIGLKLAALVGLYIAGCLLEGIL